MLWQLDPRLAASDINQLVDLDTFFDPLLRRDGSNGMLSALDMGGNKVFNLATPTLNTDAATKEYVDEQIVGLATQQDVEDAVSGLATESYVTSSIANLADQSYVSSEISAATAGLASETYVDSAVSTAVTGLATEAFATQAAADSIVGLASESYVDAGLASIEDVATAAQTARVGAEAARDAAFVAADVFEDTAAGLAATSEGDQFLVVSDDGMTIYRYRHDAGPEAALVAEYPSKTGVESKIRRTGSRDVFCVRDADGKVALRVSRHGKFFALGRNVLAQLDTAMSSASKIIASGRQMAGGIVFRDVNGKAPVVITRAGRLRVLGRDILREIDAVGGAGTIGRVSEIERSITPSKNLLVIGDSLSAYSGSWARTLIDSGAPLVDKSRTVTNLAVGGQNSSQQAGRLGALPFLLTFEDNKILASGSSVVTASQMLHPDGATLYSVWPISDQGTGPTWRARVAGVIGTFSSSSFTGGVPDDLVFTPDAGQLESDLDVDVGVPAVSAWAASHEFDTLLIAVGRNDFEAVDTVKRNWLSIRDWQRTLNKRVVIVTPPNRANEGAASGPEKYAAIVDLERFAQQHFGDCAVISRQILMRHGDGSSGDSAAIADGRVPPSLTTDGLHWTTGAGGGHEIIRAAVSEILNRKGY